MSLDFALCISQFQLRPSPPGQLRGICRPCQFRGWGISKFGTARGSGICLPRGYPRGFDTLVVSDSKSKHGGFQIAKDQQFVADWIDRHGLDKLVEVFSILCISSLLIKAQLKLSLFIKNWTRYIGFLAF